MKDLKKAEEVKQIGMVLSRFVSYNAVFASLDPKFHQEDQDIAIQNLIRYLSDSNVKSSLEGHFNRRARYESLMELRNSKDWIRRSTKKEVR